MFQYKSGVCTCKNGYCQIHSQRFGLDEILNNLPKYKEPEEESEKRKQAWIEQRD